MFPPDWGGDIEIPGDFGERRWWCVRRRQCGPQGLRFGTADYAFGSNPPYRPVPRSGQSLIVW